jgi:ferritin-like protein
MLVDTAPRTVESALDTVFAFDYTVHAPDMRRLYENAKRDQWNASRDIDWTAPAAPDGRAIADELLDIYGSPLWDSLGEAERVDLNRRVTAWRLSALLYGEQGAMLACSQLVNMVEGTDEKFFQATQVVDEARHNEVLERYLVERLDALHYPMPPNERDLFDAILSERNWCLKTIALQLVAETFAVSLFKMMADSARDPVLNQVSRRILADESRHMGFGMLSLPDIVERASEAERREFEDYTCFALEKTLTGFFPVDAYRDMFSAAQIAEIQQYRRETAARNDYAQFRKHFKRDMHGSMVANLARLGLLSERVRPRLEAIGITLPASG